MKFTSFTIWVIVIFFLLPLLGGIISFNNLVHKDEEVFGAWAQVESNYQRRFDLIPNLVKTVSAYLEHENTTLNSVIEARTGDRKKLEKLVGELAQAQSTAQSHTPRNAKVNLISEDSMQAFEQTQANLGQALGRLLVSVEAYPNLRSSDQIIVLLAQLEGTENRINVARIGFNQKVQNFNLAIRKFPGRFFASMCNFQPKAYFHSDNEAQRAVQVNFE